VRQGGRQRSGEARQGCAWTHDSPQLLAGDQEIFATPMLLSPSLPPSSSAVLAAQS